MVIFHSFFVSVYQRVIPTALLGFNLWVWERNPGAWNLLLACEAGLICTHMCVCVYIIVCIYIYICVCVCVYVFYVLICFSMHLFSENGPKSRG